MREPYNQYREEQDEEDAVELLRSLGARSDVQREADEVDSYWSESEDDVFPSADHLQEQEGPVVVSAPDFVSPDRRESPLTHTSSPQEEEMSEKLKKSRPSIWFLLSGGHLNWRQAKVPTLILLEILAFSFIGVSYRYCSIRQISTIGRLEKQLEETRNMGLFKRAAVRESDRQQYILKAIEQEGVSLAPAQEPPIVLYREDSQPTKE